MKVHPDSIHMIYKVFSQNHIFAFSGSEEKKLQNPI